MPVLTRIFGYNVKLAVPINLAVSLLTVISVAITRISLTSVEGLVLIYSIVFVLAVAAMVGAVAGGAMLGLVTSSTVKLLLGVLFIVSAGKIFGSTRLISLFDRSA